MALFRTGCYVLKTLTPVLTSPGFMIPSTVNVQVRNAGRKGYREKKTRQRLAEKRKKMEAMAPKNSAQQMKLRKKYQSIRKTVDLKKPSPPNDDVFITEDFNYKKYSLVEAIQFHKEYHHPTIFNNPEAPINVRFDIDMTGKKETQVMKPFSGIVAINHPFVIKQAKEVMVFCEPEDVSMCIECGASIAGGASLIKKVEDGIVVPSLYDHVIAHVDILPHLSPIRGLLKDQLPRSKRGTLTSDLKSAIKRFLHGIEYSCIKFECDHNFGVISCDVGKIDMPMEHIEENFRALVEDILAHRPSPERDFITWVWCFSPPSNERFALDLSKYVPQVMKSKTGGQIEEDKSKAKANTVEKKEEEEEEADEEKKFDVNERV